MQIFANLPTDLGQLVSQKLFAQQMADPFESIWIHWISFGSTGIQLIFKQKSRFWHWPTQVHILNLVNCNFYAFKLKTLNWKILNLML